jgi:hypothetical protein
MAAADDKPDWYEQEPSMFRLLTVELQRLKRRAQARWPIVILVALALTGAVLWKVARKPTLYKARFVLAITEGDAATGNDATPLNELRDYIANVLLSQSEIIKLLDERKWMIAEREAFGDDLVVTEIRDLLGIGVWRNYFQYSYAYDQRRTARVSMNFTHGDPEFAYEMCRALTYLVIAREAQHRVEMAAALEEQSRAVLDRARERLADAREAQLEANTSLAAAERRGDTTVAAIERLRALDATTALQRAEEAFFSIEATSTKEALQAAVTAAGLALEMDVVADKKPPRHDRSMVTLIGLVFVCLCIFFPLAGIVIGAFDTRVHDLDDVDRLDLALLGHLPAFPGDTVGALRDRGVRRRRMPSWVPWL